VGTGGKIVKSGKEKGESEMQKRGVRKKRIKSGPTRSRRAAPLFRNQLNDTPPVSKGDVLASMKYTMPFGRMPYSR